MAQSLRYPLPAKLNDEPVSDFETALCGLRLDDDEPCSKGARYATTRS